MALRVGEQRQVVGMRKTGELFVGREGQFVEFEDAVTARVGDDPAAIVCVAPDEVADFRERLALGQIKQQSLALADAQVVDLRVLRQHRRAERRNMHVAKDDLGVWPACLDQGGDLQCVHET